MEQVKVEIAIQCPFCGETHSVEVWEYDFYDWQEGELAQNAFPYLSATEREQLISGLCPMCQDKIFGSYED